MRNPSVDGLGRQFTIFLLAVRDGKRLLGGTGPDGILPVNVPGIGRAIDREHSREYGRETQSGMVGKTMGSVGVGDNDG